MSGMSNLGALELAGQPLRESRCLCSHRWNLHTDPRHSPLGLGAAFVPSAWPPWAIRVVEGGHSGSRHQHPRPDRPTPFNPTSSVHPRCPRNLLPHCPVLLPVATQSTGLLLGTPSNAPPRMAPESTARACELDFSCPLNPVFRVHSGPSSTPSPPYSPPLRSRNLDTSPGPKPRAQGPALLSQT